MKKDCIFCKIAANEIPCHKIGENDDFLCFLDIKPITKGHALIIPKRHFTDVLEYPAQLEMGFFAFAQQMAKRIIPAVGAEGFNLTMNTGAAAGQVIFHQHTHIIPRFTGDGLRSWPQHDASQDELRRTVEKITGSKERRVPSR